MGYVRGVVFFFGIVIIIMGLFFMMLAGSLAGVLTGIIAIIVGIIFIWKVRKSAKEEKMEIK
jgi:uncharacterized membrane protein HdeD (DUF308 family)